MPKAIVCEFCGRHWIVEVVVAVYTPVGWKKRCPTGYGCSTKGSPSTGRSAGEREE